MTKCNWRLAVEKLYYAGSVYVHAEGVKMQVERLFTSRLSGETHGASSISSDLLLVERLLRCHQKK